MLTFSRVTGIDFMRLVDFGLSEEEILERIEGELNQLMPKYSATYHGETHIRPEIIPEFILACRRQVHMAITKYNQAMHPHQPINPTDTAMAYSGPDSPKRPIGADEPCSPAKKLRSDTFFLSRPKRSYTGAYPLENYEAGSLARRRI